MMANKYAPIPIINRMSLILDIVMSNGSGVSSTELLHLLDDIPKTTLYRLLAAMTENDFLVYHKDTALYTIGYKFIWGFSIAEDHIIKLREVSEPFVKQLVDVVQETVKVSVLSGLRVYTVLSKESTKPIRITIDQGSRFEPHTGATGKILLSSLPQKVLLDYFKTPREAPTKNTITTYEEMVKELEQIHNQGYAVDIGEYSEDINAVAVPIFDSKNNIASAISVTYPAINEVHIDRAQLVENLKNTALDIQLSLSASNLQNRPARFVNDN